MESENITALESLSDEPLSFIHLGERFTLPHPARMTVEDIYVALYSGLLREMPRTMTPRQTDALFERWVARHDLPDFNGLQRLLYAVDKHRRVLEFDLIDHLSVDLVSLWKQRRWGHLLNLIDHLPRESWYVEATSNDEEYAAMVAKAAADAEADGQDHHPPLRTWSPEASLLADVVDAVRNVSTTLVAVNGGKPSQPDRTPRPQTAMEKAQKEAVQARKKRRHNSLVARMLPHKAKADD